MPEHVLSQKSKAKWINEQGEPVASYSWHQLKFKALGNFPIVLEDFIVYIPNLI